MSPLEPGLSAPLVDLLLATADDKLILGHRNADWTGLAPILEEDIAFSALAQDDIAHAQAIYELVGSLTGRKADDIAFGRAPHEYRCAVIVELHDDFDWARAIVRQFLCDHFDFLRLTRMAHSSYTPLRELAARMQAEKRLSIGHADGWVRRLGQSSGEARERIAAALEHLVRYAPGLFEPTSGQQALESAGVYPPLAAGDMADQYRLMIENVISDATLQAKLPDLRTPAPGGRTGRHSAEFPALLEEFSEVYRSEPGATW